MHATPLLQASRNVFKLNFATNTLSHVVLPDTGVLVPRLRGQAVGGGDDEDAPDDGGHGDPTAGMGHIRLSLVKLGCWVNVYAPAAVSREWSEER
jgi:DNA mismatch repair protein MSH5